MKTFYMNGIIGYDILPSTLVDFLNKTNKIEPIAIVLNTPGGSVLDGFEIFNILSDYAGPKTILLNSFVASMGSYLAALPNAKIIGRDNTVFMIHNIWGGVIGDYRDLRKYADVYEGMTDIIAEALAKRVKKEPKELRKKMDSEAWYFGKDLLDEGLVDEVAKSGEPIEGIEYNNDAEKNIYLFFNSVDKNECLNRAKLNYELSKKFTHTKDSNIEKAAALCGKFVNIQDKKPDRNITEVHAMNLKEFLDANPTAQAEYDTAINNAVSNALVKERQNTKDLLDVSGLTVSGQVGVNSVEDLKQAVDKGISAGAYAVQLVKAQQAMRSTQTTSIGAMQGMSGANFTAANGIANADKNPQEKPSAFDDAVKKLIADRKGGK